MQVTEYIPAEKFAQFHDIMCATGGHYITNPLPLWSTVCVSYVPGDYKTQRELWSRCVTKLRENRSDKWWRIVIRRLLHFFANS